MRIAIDLRWVSSDTGGIRQYALSLVSNLAQIDDKNEYLLLFRDAQTAARTKETCGLEEKKNFETTVFSPGPFSLQSQLKLPAFIKKAGIDVFHSPDFIAPLFTGRAKLVINIHDLIPYLRPDLCPNSKKVKLLPLYKIFNRLIIARAALVLTGSEYSRKDLERVFGGRGNIAVVYNGVGARYRELAGPAVDAIKQKYSFGKRNVLYTGRQDPSKNITGLIKAFKGLLDRGFSGKLVIAGKKDPRYPAPYRLAKELGMEGSIVFTGYVEDKDMPALYNASDLFVFPSFYEGFGLPVLEAMGCGLPVVSSNATSLPEVTGAAGIMVGPEDTEKLTRAMNQVLSDDGERNRLVQAGFRQVEKFSWKKTAVKTLAGYEKAFKL